MNALETNISNALEKRGWTVLRRGWPDFLIYLEGHAGQFRVAAVEVKSDSDNLSEQQEEMHRVLRAVGLRAGITQPTEEQLMRNAAIQIDKGWQRQGLRVAA